MDSELPPPDRAAASEAARRDADIVALLDAGEVRAAFEQLLVRYESKVFHLCMAMLCNDAAAQDAAQESLLRVWRALGGYDARRGALSTWIYAIARNRCLTALGQHHTMEHSLELPDIREQLETIASEAVTNDAASLQLLGKLIDRLAPMYQTCLKLYYFEDRSVDEVAAMLSLPQGTVKTHLHRARRALHSALETQGLADPVLWL
jgi:RNA polymerase sigma-70 factor (ECF subfamily)